MKKLFYVKGSPRGERPNSAQIVDDFLKAYSLEHVAAVIVFG